MKPILEAKGNGKILVILGIVFVGISMVVAILLGDSLFQGDEFSEQLFSVVPTFFPLALGAFLFAMGVRFAKTRITVYDDHIEGNCVVNNLNRDFYLKYEKISSVSLDKSVVLIQSDGVTHKINLSAKDAIEIVKYLNTKI
ncbi:MAG: hypothetical protein E7403_01840 [Ruminococcaceae bacterium]|nr:hypothetical protein [Oscillospiraceae bacterium]